MIRGLYTSASGMLSESIRTDVISNNIANVNTTGFKKELTILKAAPEMRIHRLNDTKDLPPLRIDLKPFIGNLGTGVRVDETFTSFEQGQIVHTGNKHHMALSGDGFFAVMDGAGNIGYTRDGSFTVNRDGFLVTKEGRYVLGQQGPVQIPEGDLVITERGEIRVNGQLIDTVAVVDFPEKTALEKIGDNLFRQNEASGEPFLVQSQVIQESLERSNVNSVTEMVNLITAMRAYEANQRSIHAHDETLGKAVNDVGRLG